MWVPHMNKKQHPNVNKQRKTMNITDIKESQIKRQATTDRQTWIQKLFLIFISNIWWQNVYRPDITTLVDLE